jgi:GAF domain-containing protein
VISPPADLQESYRAAFADYLDDPSEAALHVAYELGREAVAHELSILDLATMHHGALLAALRETSDVEAAVQAANDFLLETLSAFEVVRRGFREAQEAAQVEKRHALILRQLSNFLSDASLALGTTESLGEVLQLLAEQARELTGATCSVAQLEADAELPAIEAVSRSDESVATIDAAEFSGRLGADGSSMRRGRWLGAALTGWDGRRLGSIHLFDKSEGGDFTEADEAVLVHLAQMATTAVERARRV